MITQVKIAVNPIKSRIRNVEVPKRIIKLIKYHRNKPRAIFSNNEKGVNKLIKAVNPVTIESTFNKGSKNNTI